MSRRLWLGAIVVSCASVLLGCGLAGICVNEEVTRVRSPDGKLDAVLFQRDCGAATGLTTQVSVVPSGKPLPDAAGNVFGADDIHGQALTGKWGGPQARVEWLNRELVVHYARDSHVVFQTGGLRVTSGESAREEVAVDVAPE